MTHKSIAWTRITLRLSPTMTEDLRRIAAREDNSATSVARRLLASGLAREQATTAQDARTPEATT
jgi:hypothetical protein